MTALSPAAQGISELRATGALDLPLPGSGFTRERWKTLSSLTRVDVVVGRLAEAHADAVAILRELDGPEVGPADIWGVWASESKHPDEQLVATDTGTWMLTGRKLWCSGASSSTHALLTARIDGTPQLFAVALDHNGVRPVLDSWQAVGMSDSDSGAIDFIDVPAVRVGPDGAYLSRAGFWHGAIGVAACWFGGAHGVADALRKRSAQVDASPHALAHLGAVDAALFAAEASLDAAAAAIDADPTDFDGRAQVSARRVRVVIENAATETIDRVGRALGAAPLCLDHQHAKRVADLSTYVRQSHAEKDLEQLGRLVSAP